MRCVSFPKRKIAHENLTADEDVDFKLFIAI